MPSYKTHSIHGELLLPEMDKIIEIKKEDLKDYCMGPDALIETDYRIFDYQHANKVKEFFMTMLKYIKDNKLQDNSEVMAFLYGNVDHLVLDGITHPLIYYMTEDIERKHKIKPHGLVEHWIDDYIVQKYHRNSVCYYHKLFVNDNELMKMINEIYKRVYGCNFESLKYSFGMFSNIVYDTLARRNVIGIIPLVIKIINIGDFIYKRDLERVLPYLNLEHDIWLNPETKEEYHDSFDDLWKKANEVSLETIRDINKYLYGDKEFKNSLILNNTSYNTGLPCETGQGLQYIKKYK